MNGKRIFDVIDALDDCFLAEADKEFDKPERECNTRIYSLIAGLAITAAIILGIGLRLWKMNSSLIDDGEQNTDVVYEVETTTVVEEKVDNTAVGEGYDDPYDGFIDGHKVETKTDEMIVDASHIGITKQEGDWMEVYQYAGSDGFQTIVRSKDTYERAVTLCCLNAADERQLYCRSSIDTVLAFRNLIPGSKSITLEYCMLPGSADAVEVIQRDIKLQTLILQVEK